MKKHTALILTFLAAVIFAAGATNSSAQVIRPAGTITGKATQLVVMHNVAFEYTTLVQVTNTSRTSGVTLHIQLWTGGVSGNPALGDCVEVDFTDTFTPNDTHTYNLNDLIRNSDGLDAGIDQIGTFGPVFRFIGFMTITPVVSPTDRRAIAFNNMIGSVTYHAPSFQMDSAIAGLNAMGREARSFTDGSLLADGTILDGSTGGLELIQPDLLKYPFDTIQEGMDFFSTQTYMIAFSDNYAGPFGDYRSEPATVTYTPLLFDEFEVPTSCQSFDFSCVRAQGINDPNPFFLGVLAFPGNNDRELCPGNELRRGWARNSMTGIEGFENVIGLINVVNFDIAGAYGTWMVAEGDEVVPTPATPTPTAEPTATPTPDGSPTPTGGGQPNGGGGGGGCAIAGPVQASTAAANALIVLLPGIAFALRRRFSK